MKFALALCALLFAVPASASTLSLHASWHSGDAYWDRFGGFQDDRTLLVGDASFSGSWRCGVATCLGSTPSLESNTLTGVYSTSSGQQVTLNIVDGSGFIDYICDCFWLEESGNYDTARYTAGYRLTVSEVPLPATALLLLLGVSGLYWIKRPQ